MDFLLADRVQETTTTTGTGTIALGGAALQCQSFLAGIGNGNKCCYTILSGDGVNWETGLGTVTSGSPNTLSRTTILSSSAAGAAISLSGTSTVFCSAAAATIPQGKAWTAYTPTLSAVSGTLTSASASGRYLIVGKTVFVSITATITTNGTAAGKVKATLPPGVTSAAVLQILPGRENNLTGAMLQGVVNPSDTVVQIAKYDDSYPGANGNALTVNGPFESA